MIICGCKTNHSVWFFWSGLLGRSLLSSPMRVLSVHRLAMVERSRMGSFMCLGGSAGCQLREGAVHLSSPSRLVRASFRVAVTGFQVQALFKSQLASQ